MTAEKHAKAMRALAKDTGLTSDGDDRLFFDHEMISVYCNLLSPAQYRKYVKDLEKACVKGSGYTVGAWNDCSGYRYWYAQGKIGDSNYIQVTAYITDPDKVDPAQLKRDVDRMHSSLRHWHNVDEWHCWQMDQAERKPVKRKARA